jgi:hypothetical protein
MKLRFEFYLIVCLFLPLLSNAEVYKWKDKDGKIVYTDTPPPSNIKQEAIGRKKAQEPTLKAPLSPVESTSSITTKDAKTAAPPPTISAEDAAAQLRQKNAEIEKNNKQEKEAQAKAKEQNCIAAKSNLQSYTQGGRVYKMNEKGEREYMGDNDLKAGIQKSQQEVNKYCY